MIAAGAASSVIKTIEKKADRSGPRSAPIVTPVAVRHSLARDEVASGQSVTVRVNDRGPYVRSRIVDVSYAAAETLGMNGGGVAKVKLEVVQ